MVESLVAVDSNNRRTVGWSAVLETVDPDVDDDGEDNDSSGEEWHMMMQIHLMLEKRK